MVKVLTSTKAFCPYFFLNKEESFSYLKNSICQNEFAPP